MTLRWRAAALIALGAAVVPAANAQARGWSAPAILERGCAGHLGTCVSEPSPRVAVNGRGQAAVAWVDGKSRIRVATGDARGFTRARTIEKGLRPGVTIARDGTVVVAWSRDGELRFTRRRPGHGFSLPAVLAPRSGRSGDDFVKAAIQPDGSTLVVYERLLPPSRLAGVLISPAGRPGSPTSLGPGALDRDGFRAATDGDVAVCCLWPAGAADTNTPPNRIAAYAPGGGWTVLTPPLALHEQVESVAASGGEVVAGTVDVAHAGDLGTSGLPGLLRADRSGLFAPPLAARVARPGIAFGPGAAIDGARRNVLVYQEKRAPKAYSREAPIWAVTGLRADQFGARQLLDPRLARAPAMIAYRAGALVAWEAPAHRWGVAVERDARFAPAPTPPGGPSPVGEDFIRNRDLTAGGRYAALAWTAADGSIRVSIGVL